MTHLSREGTSDGPLHLGGSIGPGLGAGDGVAGNVATVDVVLDAIVSSLIKCSAGNAVGAVGAWIGGAGAGDLNVDTLRVGLGAVLLGCGVESDDLVTEDVVASGERLWNGEGPRVVVGYDKC